MKKLSSQSDMRDLWMLCKNKLPLFFQLTRFGIVGLTGAAIQFSIVVLFVQNKICVPLTANIFGFMIAFIATYWGHSLWTFKNQRGAGGVAVLHHVAITKLFVVQIVNFVCNESLFYVFLLFKLHYQIALLIVLTVMPIFTFIASKFWVFKR